MTGKQQIKSWERPVEWALGNMDEALFNFGSFMLSMSRKPPYTSDQAGLAWLEKTAQSPVDLSSWFSAPPPPIIKLITSKNLPLTALPLGVSAREFSVSKIEYPSAIKTGFPANDTVHGLYLQRRGYEDGPVLIYLHGWMEFEPGLSLRLPLSWASQLNLNILALHMPFHFERTQPGTLSGELSITGNLPLAVKGMQQAISDVRQALGWLKRDNPQRTIGLGGKSLGGLVGAMTLVIEPGFEAAVLAVPATSTRASIWRSAHTRRMRQDLTSQGLDEEATARLLEIIRPGRYRPLLDPARILILKARADRVCFPDDTDRFTDQWQTPVLELPTGHITATFDPRGRRAVQLHLKHFLSGMG